MTDEEIKKLAEQYVKEVHYDDYFLEEATRVIQWLTKNFCIIPKSKIAEWKGIVDDALKADHVINEPAFRLMWERLFEEDKK